MKRFFNPNKIAIIGASNNLNKVGGILVKKAKEYGGEIIPVNNADENVQGLRAYKKISDYAGKVDLGIIAVPSKFISEVLKDCANAGIKKVIIITAGFSEIGNGKEELEMLESAKKAGMKVIGPNCFGICNPYSNLDVTFSATTPEKGEIAFISQSGALWSFISDYSIGKFGFSGFVSLGNMGDLEFSDFIEYFAKDEKTKSIVCYIEKLKDGKRFINAARKCKKKIYAVKAGSSAEGSKAAVSHTGSLATDYAIYKGALKQAGVILCESLEEAFEKASGKTLVEKRINPDKLNELGNRVMILTNAGGAGALASDYLSNKGYKLSKIRDLKNPWDILGTARSEDYKAALEQLDPNDYDFIVAIVTPQSMTDIEEIADVFTEFSKAGRKIVSLILGEKVALDSVKLLRRRGFLAYNTLEEFRMCL